MLLHTDIGEAFVKSWAPRRHYSFLQVIAIYLSWAHLVMMSVSAAIGDMMLAHDQAVLPPILHNTLLMDRYSCLLLTGTPTRPELYFKQVD